MFYEVTVSGEEIVVVYLNVRITQIFFFRSWLILRPCSARIVDSVANVRIRHLPSANRNRFTGFIAFVFIQVVPYSQHVARKTTLKNENVKTYIYCSLILTNEICEWEGDEE